MRLLRDTEHVLFHVEDTDTVDRVASLIDLLSSSECTERVKDDGSVFAIHIQPADDRLPFLIIVPKDESIDDTLLTLCAAYVRQQDSLD